MNQIDFEDLENQTIELSEVCEKLTEENRKLRAMQSALLHEKSQLQAKIHTISERVCQLLSKLRITDANGN